MLIRRDHPRCCSAMCICSIVICSKFPGNHLTVYVPGGRSLVIIITFVIGFYHGRYDVHLIRLSEANSA